MAEVSWIDLDVPGRLGLMPKPEGGAALSGEIRQLKNMGVAYLVSALTAPEEDYCELQNEEALAREAGIEFRRFSILDENIPPIDSELRALVRELGERLDAGETVVVHCRFGIGRSSILCAAIMCERGHGAEEALKLIEQARGCPVPDTLAQRIWVREYHRACSGVY